MITHNSEPVASIYAQAEEIPKAFSGQHIVYNLDSGQAYDPWVFDHVEQNIAKYEHNILAGEFQSEPNGGFKVGSYRSNATSYNEIFLLNSLSEERHFKSGGFDIYKFRFEPWNNSYVSVVFSYDFTYFAFRESRLLIAAGAQNTFGYVRGLKFICPNLIALDLHHVSLGEGCALQLSDCPSLRFLRILRSTYETVITNSYTSIPDNIEITLIED